jgi:hypothetical protein
LVSQAAGRMAVTRTSISIPALPGAIVGGLTATVIRTFVPKR